MGAALAAIIRYKLSIRLSCYHASNRHCLRYPYITGFPASTTSLDALKR
jgi:hypothetical protein